MPKNGDKNRLNDLHQENESMDLDMFVYSFKLCLATDP